MSLMTKGILKKPRKDRKGGTKGGHGKSANRERSLKGGVELLLLKGGRKLAQRG